MNRNDYHIALGAYVVGVVALVALMLSGTGNGEPKAERQPAARQYQKHRSYQPYAQPQRKVETFAFDPNTADSTQLLRLGLKPWQVRNIYKYRAAGGIYRTKEDFARLYGLTVKDYRRLEPYIRISDDYRPAATLVGERPRYERDTLQHPMKIDSTQHIVLNTADTTQLKRVPGIGSYYAKEIVRYGRWLGGYVSVEQLDEIDQFPTSAKKYFVVTNPSPQRLNINSLSIQQLRRHPYINYFMAKTIVEHRRLHGRIKNLQELSGYRDFTPQIIQRLEPYIAY